MIWFINSWRQTFIHSEAWWFCLHIVILWKTLNFNNGKLSFLFDWSDHSSVRNQVIVCQKWHDQLYVSTYLKGSILNVAILFQRIKLLTQLEKLENMFCCFLLCLSCILTFKNTKNWRHLCCTVSNFTKCRYIIHITFESTQNMTWHRALSVAWPSASPYDIIMMA